LDTTEDKSLEENKQSTEETEEVETEEETETEETAETTTEETQTAEGIDEETDETLEETKGEETGEAVTEEQPEEGEEAAEEEEEKGKKREEIPEEEIVEERTYTIPLSRAWIAPRKKRVPRAMRMVRAFIEKHMKIETGIKTDEEEEETSRLVISDEVNRKLWSHGIEKPPRNIRVRAVKDKEGTVTLYLAEGD
jgi:large subunit ribosomal protein L31e